MKRVSTQTNIEMSRAVFPNLLKVAEHLKKKLSENFSYILPFLALNNMDFIFWGEHFKTARRALVVPEQWLGTTGLVSTSKSLEDKILISEL